MTSDQLAAMRGRRWGLCPVSSRWLLGITGFVAPGIFVGEDDEDDEDGGGVAAAGARLVAAIRDGDQATLRTMTCAGADDAVRDTIEGLSLGRSLPVRRDGPGAVQPIEVQVPGEFTWIYETGAPLHIVAAAPAIPADMLTQLADTLPRSSHRLADFAAELANQLASHHRQLTLDRPDTFLPNLASSLNDLSIRRGDLSRRGDALAAVTEAVTIRRQLAQLRPAVHQDELNQSLRTQRWLEDLE